MKLQPLRDCLTMARIYCGYLRFCVSSESGVNCSTCGSKYRVHFRLGYRKERSHHDSVELRPAAGSQSSGSFFEWKTFAIRTRGDHRVISVYDANDTRNDGNLRIPESRGISRAIHAFVVMENVQRS